MDGNGRWAKQRRLPRVAGHRKGVEAVRATVRACVARGVEYLTLFAFSSENWRRPADEVSILMQLFLRTLEQEVAKLDENGIRFRVIGDTSHFETRIRELIAAGEKHTAHNERLTLTVAANYGGRWDIAQAARRLIASEPDADIADQAIIAQATRAGSFHPHGRRAAYLELLAVATRLHGIVFHRPAVARFRRGRTR